MIVFVNNPTPTLMRYDSVEQQIPRRILNRRLLNRRTSQRLLIRSDGLHGPVAPDAFFSISFVVFSTVVMVFTVLVVVISLSLLRERTRLAVTVTSTVLLSYVTAEGGLSVLVSTVCWSLPLAASPSGNTVSQSTTDGCSSTGKDGIAQHCGLES